MFLHLRNYFHGKANFEEVKNDLNIEIRGAGERRCNKTAIKHVVSSTIHLFHLLYFTCEIISVNSHVGSFNGYILGLSDKIPEHVVR